MNFIPKNTSYLEYADLKAVLDKMVYDFDISFERYDDYSWIIKIIKKNKENKK